jgi:uncharacterized protein
VKGVYLDASAVVKLLRPEPETAELIEFLAARPLRVSSDVLRVELACVCHRQGMGLDPAEDLLAGLMLLPLSAKVLEGARRAFEPPLRALDAIHLSAATEAHEQLDCFVTYDRDQATAATELGWRVEAPR